MQLENSTYNHLRFEHQNISIILQRLLHSKYINKHKYGDTSFLSKTNGIHLLHTKNYQWPHLSMSRMFYGANPLQARTTQNSQFHDSRWFVPIISLYRDLCHIANACLLKDLKSQNVSICSGNYKIDYNDHLKVKGLILS